MGEERASPLLVLGGPTAGGKSELALAFCHDRPADIVCADSGVIYRRLDIGTGKPTPKERALVPHHLLDVRDPAEPFSVAEYGELAAVALRACAAGGRRPLLVGGTGLYIRQVLEAPRLPPVPPQPALRAELAGRPAAALFAELAAADPAAASRIHPADVRRVIRALEVLRVTGRPISAAWADSRPERRPCRFVVVDRPREVLRRRIAQRVERMLEAGLVGEVAALLAAGVPPAAQSLQALGYRQTVVYLRAGGGPAAELRAAIVAATVRYAKRQRTWFRAEPGAVWLDLGDGPAAAGLPALEAAWEWTGRGDCRPGGA